MLKIEFVSVLKTFGNYFTSLANKVTEIKCLGRQLVQTFFGLFHYLDQNKDNLCVCIFVYLCQNKPKHLANGIDVINNKPKLRTYKKFKASLDPANYLTWNLQKSERSLFAQFRCGIYS